MVARSLLAPIVHEFVDRFRDAYSAVGIANVENLSGDRFAHRVDQFECGAGRELTEIEKRDGAVGNPKIDAEPVTGLSMMDRQVLQSGLAVREIDVGGPVMAE